jgi:hypothetical protein
MSEKPEGISPRLIGDFKGSCDPVCNWMGVLKDLSFSMQTTARTLLEASHRKATGGCDKRICVHFEVSSIKKRF